MHVKLYCKKSWVNNFDRGITVRHDRACKHGYIGIPKKNETNFSIKIYISINNGNKNKYVDEQKKNKLNNNNE